VRRVELGESLSRCHRICAGLLAVVLLFGRAQAQPQDHDALLQRYAQLREQLANSPFQRPIVLESSDVSGRLKGEIYAQLEKPFAVIAPQLQTMAQWCDVLILHLNVKTCRPASVNSLDTLEISLGRKFEQPLADAYPLNFRYQVTANRTDFLQVQLTAADGPMGTHDYGIELQMVALDGQRSFLHLSYAYSYGLVSQAAMQGYLTTIGRDKVGFSIIGHGSDGQPIYQDGMLGVVERNTMRYYLALEAYLGALAGSPEERQEQRLNDWYNAVERYPLQLHELERREYLAMKHKEIRRQQEPVAEEPLP
jgi:hypothetical protein